LRRGDFHNVGGGGTSKNGHSETEDETTLIKEEKLRDSYSLLGRHDAPAMNWGFFIAEAIIAEPRQMIKAPICMAPLRPSLESVKGPAKKGPTRPPTV